MPSLKTWSTASGRGHAFHHGEGGLVDERHQHAVGDEAGRIVDFDRRFAQLDGQRMNGREGLVAGSQAAHNLHQRHHRHGIEEVHSDDLLGPAGPRGQFGDGDGGGVGGEDGLGGRMRRGRERVSALSSKRSRGGFDDEVAACQLLAVGQVCDAGQSLVALLGVSLAFRLPAQVLADGVQPAIEKPAPRQHSTTEFSLAKTWAMPLPIVPAPITPTVFMSMIASDY